MCQLKARNDKDEAEKNKKKNKIPRKGDEKKVINIIKHS